MASHSSASSTLLVYDVGHMKFWQSIKRPPCAAELPLTCPIQIDQLVMAITSADANVRHSATDVARTTSVARMMTLGTPELVLVLIALGGMTAAATWGVIELKRPRK